MDKKLNNLLDIEEISQEKFLKKSKTTKRTDVAKDILLEDTGKNVFNEKPKEKDIIAHNKYHNLISLDDFTKEVPTTSSKATKRTEVAKDVLKESTGKEVFNEKPKTKNDTVLKNCHNLLNFDDFSKSEPNMNSKATKRTDVAKDVLLEKKKAAKAKECEDDKKKEKCDDEPKKGLSAAQKKLPEALQKAILKRQGK
jgi:hypothetical protein